MKSIAIILVLLVAGSCVACDQGVAVWSSQPAPSVAYEVTYYETVQPAFPLIEAPPVAYVETYEAAPVRVLRRQRYHRHVTRPVLFPRLCGLPRWE